MEFLPTLLARWTQQYGMARAVSVDRDLDANGPEEWLECTRTDAICSGTTTEGCRSCFGYHLRSIPDQPVDIFDTEGHVSFGDEGMSGGHVQGEGLVS